MELSDVTTEIARTALMSALEAIEGADLYNGGPWAIDMRLMAEPKAVIYQAANGDTYERTFSLEIEGETVNAVLSQQRSKVEPRTVWIPVPGTGSFSISTKGWTGRIFRAGEYRERGLSFSTDDLAGMVAKFPAEGVPIQTEHINTVWDIALKDSGAKLARIWTENGGTELFGEFLVPGWAKEALDKIKKTVSVGLTSTFDALREVSLVLNPRVEDALIFSMATAFKADPSFTAFASAHPAAAATIATVAKTAPDPATPMNPQQIKEAAWTTFSADPKNAGVTREEFEAAFSKTPEPPAKSTEDPVLRAEIDAIKRQMNQQAEFTADQQDESDALKFYRDNIEKYGPANEEKARADFSLRRRLDRLSAKASGAQFSANAEESEEATFRKEVEAMPKLFNFGPGHLSSVAPAFTPSGEGLGIFSAQDFDAIREKK